MTIATDIQSLYIAYFNRPADYLGLKYWTAQAEANKGSVAAVANAFSASPEYTAQYAGKSTAAIIDAIYQNLFGRVAEPAAIEYWGKLYDNKVFNIGNIATSILQGAQNADKIAVDSKVQAATAFYAAMDTNAEIVGYDGAAANAVVKAWMAGITTKATADAATTAVALNTVLADAAAAHNNNTGTAFTLTTGIDVLNGTINNDTFVATSDGAATSTSNLGDQINGGAGVDTVKIYSTAATTVIPNLTGIEKLWLNDTVHESNDVSGIAGLTSLELNGGKTLDGATITQTLGAGQSLTLSGIANGEATTPTLGDGGISIATGTAAAVNLGLQDVSGGIVVGIAGAGATTLNLTSTGSNNIGLVNAGAALTTINVTGAGSTTIAGAVPATIATFNASTATGAVTVDLSGSTAATQTITGGSAADSLTVDLARNIGLDAGAGNDLVTLANATAANLSATVGAADSIKGGDGTDTLAVTAAGLVSLAGDTAADRAAISGFEQLRSTTDLNGAAFDISAFGINYLQINAATTTANATISGFATNATVEYRAVADSVAATGTVNVVMTGATGAGTPNDTLNIKLNADIADQANAAAATEFSVGVAGINKLVVSTADRSNADAATAADDGYILNLSNDNNVDTITVTGDRELSFTSTASTAALANINATALTGNLILDLGTNGLTQGVTVAGGAGVNTISGTTFGDVITGGAKADFITGGAGADVLTGGTGADTFTFAVGASGLPAAGTFDSITDFAKASDIIDFGATALSIVSGSAAASGTAGVNAQGVATFNSADDTLAKKIIAAEAGINASGVAAAGQYVVFEDAGSSYVLVSDGTDGLGANDVLIKLVGVTGLTTSTITGGDLTLA